MLLAHLTDIHVGDERDYEPAWASKVRKHSERLLERLLEDLAAQRPDHVALTGDLTQTSKPQEFARARAYLDAHLGGTRVSVLPGNHDRWSPEAQRLFAASFGDLARCDLGGRSGFPFCHLAENVALVALDSSPYVPGEDPAEVKGFVSREQLGRFAAIAGDPRLSGRSLVVLIHHHLRLSDEDALAADPKDPTPLANAAEVELALRQAPVSLVLHGHRHKQMRLELHWDGRKVTVLCPGSATRVDVRRERTARYGLYRLENGVLGEVRTRAYCPEKDAFDWA